jgi:hypothetical protein
VEGARRGAEQAVLAGYVAMLASEANRADGREHRMLCLKFIVEYITKACISGISGTLAETELKGVMFTKVVNLWS